MSASLISVNILGSSRPEGHFMTVLGWEREIVITLVSGGVAAQVEAGDAEEKIIPKREKELDKPVLRPQW